MKQLLKYGAMAALLLALAGACQAPAASPEEVLRQYQAHIDKNEFDAAAKLSTPANRAWLSDLAAIISAEEQEGESVLYTKFINIAANGRGDTLLLDCTLQDQYEIYSAVFRLVRLNGQWRVDVPQDEVYIDFDLIDEIPDTLLRQEEPDLEDEGDQE
jgi:hypothetical protein